MLTEAWKVSMDKYLKKLLPVTLFWMNQSLNI